MEEKIKEYILWIDEINALTDESYLESGGDSNKVIDDFLSFLSLSYVRGVESVEDMIEFYMLDIDTSDMEKSIYKEIDGKNFADRVTEHMRARSLPMLKTLAESEAQRVFLEAELDASKQYTKKTGKKLNKTWHTMEDERVRDTHFFLDGVKIPVDEEFHTIDGDSAPAPHGFYLAENNVNCRCFLSVSRA